MIASDNSYGRHGRNDLLELFKSNNICVDVDELFSIPYNMEELVNIIKKLGDTQSTDSKATTNVVIIFALGEVAQILLNIAEEQELYGITWILTEASGINGQSFTDKRASAGLFTIGPYGGHYPEFEDYFWNISRSQSNINLWVKQLFDMREGKRLYDFKEDFLLPMTFVGYVRNAVYAYAIALRNYRNNDFLRSNSTFMPFYRYFDNTVFLKYFRSVTFPGLANETVRFDSVGDIDSAIFFVYNLQMLEGAPILKNVGTWSSDSGLHIDHNITWNNGNPPLSVCSEHCKPGFYPIVNVGKRCCWICVQCAAGSAKSNYGNELCTLCLDVATNENRTRCVLYKFLEAADNTKLIFTMYVLIFFGSVISLCVMFTLIKFKATPIVKASNLRLSVTQVTLHLTLFLTLILYTLEVDVILCTTRVFVVGFQIILILSIMLVKAQQLLRIFRSHKKITEHEIFVANTVSIGVICGTAFVNICGTLIILVIENIRVVTVLHAFDKTKEVQCLSDHYIRMQVVFVIVLALICGVQAFRSRNLPSTYNEAKFILYSVFFMLVFLALVIPLQVNSNNFFVKNYMLAMCMYGANISVLCIIYGNKVWIIWQQPEKNTVDVFRKSIAATNLSSTPVKKLSIATRSFGANNFLKVEAAGCQHHKTVIKPYS